MATSQRGHISSRRTLSESSEAEGTVTYNRELVSLMLNVNTSRGLCAGSSGVGGYNSQHVSPSGSEVSEAGTSHNSLAAGGSSSRGNQVRQPTPASPTESDVSAAESSSMAGGRVGTDHSNPASPSGSEVDEPVQGT